MANQTKTTLPTAGTSTFNADLQAFLRQEDADRYDDLFISHVVSGGTHSTGASLTQTPASLTAYCGGYYVTETGSITYPDDATHIYVIAHKDTTSSVANWTRVTGTHYLFRSGTAAEPSLPNDSAWLMKVTTASGSVTTVEDRRFRRPYPLHVTTSAPTATDDDSKGFFVGFTWVDTSTDTIYQMADATTGAAVWDTVAGLASEVRDADGDTKIQVEESADEDIIRFDVAGTEIGQATSSKRFGPLGVISTSGDTSRTLADRFDDVFNVKDFGAVGDGVADDTAAINATINNANVNKKKVYVPAGTYLYDGGGILNNQFVTMYGDGPTASIIRSRLASPTNGYLIKCKGVGSGISFIKFDSNVTQTSGSYVLLEGARTFLKDFTMNGDFNGVLMTGSASHIRDGIMVLPVTNAIRIRVEGGDAPKVIDNVVLSSNTTANIANSGIRVRSSSALILVNSEILEQGTGLLIDPTDISENVFSLFCSNTFFDNCSYGIDINPTGGGHVLRSKFFNVWTSSSDNDGLRTRGSGAGFIKGLDFYGLQSNDNGGSGCSIGGNISDINFIGGNFSQNVYGMFLSGPIDGFKIIGADFGVSDNFTENTTQDLQIGGAGWTNVSINSNYFSSTNKISGFTNVPRGSISKNSGFITENSGTGSIASGSTSDVITHGLSVTPLGKDIRITLVEQGTNDPGNIWVDTVSPTQFTVNCRNDPGASNLDFEWQAIVL